MKNLAQTDPGKKIRHELACIAIVLQDRPCQCIVEKQFLDDLENIAR